MQRRTLAALLLATVMTVAGTACSTPSGPAARSAPGPCEDPSYARLRAADPDELSDREWQRLRELEAQCQQLRLNEARGQPGWGRGWHGSHGWWHGPGFGVGMILVLGALIVAL